MPRKSVLVLQFVALLALLAQPMWLGREQWHFGQRSDDGVYLATAKSIATGQGYRLLHLPGAPYAIKYPPLYPAYLSIAWLIRPDFPAVTHVAAFLQAALLPVFLALLLKALYGFGFSARRVFLVVGISLVSMQMMALTITLFSELLCMCLLLGVILAGERSARSDSPGSEATRWALAAGLLAGLAYLTRTAALPIFAAVPVFFVLRKRPRLVLYFFLAALPLAAGWHLWVLAHAPTGPTTATSGYLTEYLRMIQLKGFWSNFMTQVAAVSAGVTEDTVPGFIALLFGLPLFHIVFAAAISGAIRIGRRCNWPLYVIFSGFYCLMIFLWWSGGEGVTRLVLPIWPMLIAGMSEEAAHVAGLFEQTMAKSDSWKRRSPVWMRIPRWALIGLGLLIIFRNDRNAWTWAATTLPEEHRERLDDEVAFSWIASHKTPDTVVLAWKDATTFLYTGADASRGLFITATPQTPQTKTFATSFEALPRQYTRGFLLLLRSDLGNTFNNHDLQPLQYAALAFPGSKLEFTAPGAFIYSFSIPRTAN